MQRNRWIQSIFSVLAIVGLTLTLIGCGGGQKKETQPSQPPAKTNQTQTSSTSGGNPITAPVDYLGAVGQAARFSKKVINTVQIQEAVRQFQAIEGRYPASLQELVQKGYLPRLPALPPGYRLQYDPRTGQVRAIRVR